MRVALCALALLAVLGTSSAQTVYLPVNGSQSYAGPSIPNPHPDQVYRLFLPTSPGPPAGYPVLLDLDLSGFIRSDMPDTIEHTDGLLHDALEAGIAVISATCTIVRGGNTGNPVTYPGNGVFIPPSAGIPPGYTGIIAPYLHPARPMPEKDAIMLVQHVKFNAASLGIDASRIAAFGTSAGAVVWEWVVMGPNRSDIWLNPQGQELESTRVSAGLLGGGVTWWPSLAVSKPLANFDLFHFPIFEPGDYDEPANELDEVDDDWLIESSALHYGMQPGTLALNQALPLYIYYGAKNNGTNFVMPPYDAGTEEDAHSVWSGFAWKLSVPQSRLVIVNPSIANGVEDEVVSSSLPELVACSRLTWLVEALNVPLADAWTTLGGEIAGTNGPPTLTGCGYLLGGDPISLTVANGPSQGFAYFFGGFGFLNMPFLGGAMIPTPDVIRLFPLGFQGELGLGTTLPSGIPSGTTLFWQAWMPDMTAPFGYSATNGLASLVP